MSRTLAGLATLPIIANRRRPGTASRRISTRLAPRSVAWLDRPVRLPPGRARLATRPVATGSPGSAKTIGIIVVACFAAKIDWVPYVTITSPLGRTNSAGISAARSLRPSAQRYSIATFRPSFDHLVGAGEQRRWHVEAERSGGRQIDDQFELSRLHDRQVRRLC